MTVLVPAWVRGGTTAPGPRGLGELAWPSARCGLAPSGGSRLGAPRREGPGWRRRPRLGDLSAGHAGLRIGDVGHGRVECPQDRVGIRCQEIARSPGTSTNRKSSCPRRTTSVLTTSGGATPRARAASAKLRTGPCRITRWGRPKAPAASSAAVDTAQYPASADSSPSTAPDPAWGPALARRPGLQHLVAPNAVTNWGCGRARHCSHGETYLTAARCGGSPRGRCCI